MGNAICMTTPNTAAATGAPVKLMTYAGVPLDALVAYERAALDLPHDTHDLIKQATNHLRSALRACATTAHTTSPSSLLAAPFFSRACLEYDAVFEPPPPASTSSTTSLLTPPGGDYTYVNGVPVWLQDLAQAWRTASEQQQQQQYSHGAALGEVAGSTARRPPSPPPPPLLRPELQAMWVTKSSHLLQEFVCTQKYAKALQRARRALKSGRQGSAALGERMEGPRVFADVFKAYESLARSLQDGKAPPASTKSGVGSAASSRHHAGESCITPAMWCVLLCRYLRSLPEPLLPPLCSRRLEPLIGRVPAAQPHLSSSSAPRSTAAAAAPQRSAALHIVMESFAQISIVRYITLCYVVELMHHHRSELSGDEVEALAAAMTRESAVPHVVRELAHSCKPEARMFWPRVEDVAVPAEGVTVQPRKVLPGGDDRHGSAGSTGAAELVAHKVPAASSSAAHRNKEVASIAAAATTVRRIVRSATVTMTAPSEDDSDDEEEDSDSPTASYNSSSLRTEESSSSTPVPTPAGRNVRGAAAAAAERPSEMAMRLGTASKATVAQQIVAAPPPQSSAMCPSETSSSSSSCTSSSSSLLDTEDRDGDDDGKESKDNVNSEDEVGFVASGSSRRKSTEAAAASHAVAPLSPQMQQQQLTTPSRTTTQKAAAAVSDTAPMSAGPQANALSLPLTAAVVAAAAEPSSTVPIEPRKVESQAEQQQQQKQEHQEELPSTPRPAAASTVEAPSLVALSPVRRPDVSLLSQRGRDTTGPSDADILIPSVISTHPKHTAPHTTTHMTTTSTAASPTRSTSTAGVAPAQLRVAATNMEKEEREAGGRAATMVGYAVSTAVQPRPNAAVLTAAMTPAPTQGYLYTKPGLATDIPAAQQEAPHNSLYPQRRGDAQAEGAAASGSAMTRTPEVCAGRPPVVSPGPYHAQQLQPRLAALYEAKQRFLAASVSEETWGGEGRAAPSTRVPLSFASYAGVLDAHHDPPSESAWTLRVLDSLREHGWTADEVVGALERLRRESPAQSPPPASAGRAAPLTGPPSSSAIPGLTGASDLLSFTSSGPLERRASLPSNHSNAINGFCLPPRAVAHSSELPAGVPADTHRPPPFIATTASLLPLDFTREFRLASLSGHPSAGGHLPLPGSTTTAAARSVLDNTGAALLTTSPDNTYADIRRAEVGHLLGDQLGGGDILTRQPAASTAAAAAAAPPSVSNTEAVVALERELRRLREAVRVLETAQFAQSREAAAQTAELAARCAELQRQQHTQEREGVIARTRLMDVRNELEDLRDDDARLHMRLATAQQESARLREALVTGTVRR